MSSVSSKRKHRIYSDANFLINFDTLCVKGTQITVIYCYSETSTAPGLRPLHETAA